ncbi:MAG: TolC family protein [Actinomycetota bacterium]
MAALLLGGCTVSTTPVDDAARAARADRDRQALSAASTAAVDRPLTLYRAQAIALKHNVDRRQKMMEEVLAQRLNQAAGYTLLPQVAASAGYFHRNNDYLTTSYTPSSDTTADPSLSVERLRAAETFAVAWNVLDFGVSYLRARQAADGVLAARERRRKVVQIILNDVRSAYWRALNEQRTAPQVDFLIERVRSAWSRLDSDRSIKWDSPAQALEYRKTLLGIMQHLQGLRRALAAGKLDLATLMNVDLNRPLVLAEPGGIRPATAFATADLAALERTALVNRPELREADYQARIDTDETRKAMLRMLPGLEFGTVLNHDSNAYAVNKTWVDSSVKLVWNLMNLVAGPSTVEAYKTQEQVGELRRLSASMAVIAQVNLAARRLQLASADYDVAARLADVEDRLYQTNAAAAASEAESIRRAAVRLDARYRSDMAFIEVENASGALAISVGSDPVPEAAALDDIDELARILEDTATREAVQSQPTFPVAAPPPLPAAPPPTPQPIAAPAAPPPAIAAAGPSRLTAAAGRFARDPVVQPFVVLEQLAEQGDITAEERESRRAANLAALLPYSAGKPFPAVSATPSVEEVRARLAAAGPDGRSLVLDSVLSRGPAANPSGRPAVAQAKDRVVGLAAAGLVSREEMQAEVMAVYKAEARR